MAEPRGPVDHGVQIRFITEPEGATEKSTLRRGARRPAKDARASSYGVAVRVQGIAGQPFVVLNSGDKGGDSFGVQIKGDNSKGTPGTLSSDSELPENPYSQVQGSSAPSQGSTSDEELGARWNRRLLRSQSQASLAGPTLMGPNNRSSSLLELAPPEPSPGNTIDTAPLSSVDSLISKFNHQVGGQVRGRTGRRTRTLPHEQRKRSQSLDSRPPQDALVERESQSTKHWIPSKNDSPVDNSKQPLPLQSKSPLGTFSRSRQTQDWVLKSFEEPQEKAQDPAVLQLKSTPDLLRDQQETAPPDSMDHVKATIFGILREGSSESEASVRRKVSLVLEQMQPLSMIAPASNKTLAGQGELTRRVEELQKKLDEEMKKRQRLEPSQVGLERQLEEKAEECSRLQELLERRKGEVQQSTKELQNMKLLLDQGERLRHGLETQVKELQNKLKQGQSPEPAKEVLLKDLVDTRELLEEVLEGKQRVEEQLRLRERELTALKGALKEEVASRDQEVEHVRQQYQRDTEKLRRSMQDASQDHAALEAERQKMSTLVLELQRELEETSEETGHWQNMFQKNKEELRATKQELLQLRMEKEEIEEELGEKIEVLQRNLDQSRGGGRDAQQVEELKKELHRTKEEVKELQAELQSQEMSGRHRDRELEKQLVVLRVEADRGRELEQQNLQLQKTIQQLRLDCEEASKAKLAAKAEAEMLGQRRAAVETTLRETQEENDEFRRHILGLEQQLKESRGLAEGGEVVEARLREKVQRLEAEKQRLQEALNVSQEEEGSLAASKRALEIRLDEAQRGLLRMGQEQQALNRALEEEGKQREALRRSKAELEEQKRLLDRTVDRLNKEEKVSRLEAELDEEKNTVELLTDRVNRSRDQMDQLRTELMQERSTRQDLECDKISLERQNKDLKTRLASTEGLQKPNANLSQLESQNQLLQEKLQAEEREKTVLQSTNRKLERRVKELTIQIDDERQHVNDQKDQLSLRVKALKRQVDEAEEEIERLDGLRKKAQRELEEQQEVNEQLHTRIKSLEKDAWRKTSRSVAESALKHEGLSSDEEFDSVYDPSSIASLLTESNLQTSSC
ncbi:PREDICTED: cingulin [Dipodomys ordii]|uniref:Cingulin n=1 Tax=Dipodomys ordii TaxID=10020 RepID=A0A1S3F2X9_DIPOR|nr:PREDICTED: cingulin [Dipodomys ordii]